MNRIKQLLLMSVFSLGAMTAFAASTTSANTNTSPSTAGTNTSDSSASIVGSYACKGHDPINNNDYNNKLSVTKTGDTYSFQWTDDNGYPMAYGTGILNTNLKNIITVGFVDAKATDRKGILIYQISGDGSLQARWTLKTETKVGTETCKK